MQLKRQQPETPFAGIDICQIVSDDWEVNAGDDEYSDETSETLSDSSLSLSGKQDGNVSEPDEFNLNCSFTGGYLPNTDLSRVDKGLGNPQFLGL